MKHKEKKRRFIGGYFRVHVLAPLLLLAAVGDGLSQRTLVEWHFPENPDNAMVDNGLLANSHCMISAEGGAGGVTFPTLSPSTAPGAQSGCANATGWDGGGGTKFWMIEFASSNYTGLALSSRQRSSSAGPANFCVQYRIGEGCWEDISGGILICANNFNQGVITHLPLPSACNDQSLIAIRWLMTGNMSVTNGTVSAGGTSNIDDVMVRGTRMVVPVPRALSATDIGNSQFSANWTSVEETTGYQLDVAATPAFAPGDPGSSLIFDFEGAGETKSGYAAGIVTLRGVAWELTDVLIGISSNDWKCGIRSARLRGNSNSVMTMKADLTHGLDSVVFQYRRYGTDSQVSWKTEYSADGGQEWTQIGSDFTAPDTGEVQTFFCRVGIAGNARVRIKRVIETGTADHRLNIDNVALTSYSPGDFLSGYQSRSVTGTVNTLTGLVHKQWYYYRVRAVDGAVISENSNIIRVRADDSGSSFLILVH